MKAEAMRAGIVDVDGLRLLDADAWSPVKDAGQAPASEVIGKLRRDKPWLFGAAQSSSAGGAPVAAPARRRLATEMTIEEWRAARAELIRRRGLCLRIGLRDHGGPGPPFFWGRA